MKIVFYAAFFTEVAFRHPDIAQAARALCVYVKSCGWNRTRRGVSKA